MSALLARIQSDTMAAMKSGDRARVEVLRMVSSQVKYKLIETHQDATDEDVISVLRKQVKELSEAAAQFATAGRQDLVGENDAQITILKQYLPAEISDAELTALVQDFIAANAEAYAANPRALTGKIVGALKSKAAPDRISKIYMGMGNK